VKDYERVRDQLAELTQPLVDEPIQAIGYFMREGTTQDSWRRGPRWLRRTFAPRKGVPGDQLGMYGLVVLTPTRVVLVKAVHGPPVCRPQRVIGAWPFGALSLTRATVTTESYRQDHGTTRTRVWRVTLTFADGTEPLAMDFLARNDLTKEIVPALEAALGR
jgi:hypothetical protein